MTTALWVIAGLLAFMCFPRLVLCAALGALGVGLLLAAVGLTIYAKGLVH